MAEKPDTDDTTSSRLRGTLARKPTKEGGGLRISPTLKRDETGGREKPSGLRGRLVERRRADDEITYGRKSVRDPALERASEPPERLSGHAEARTIDVVKDEDAPPLSKSLVFPSGMKVHIGMVADGLGGAAAGLRKPEGEESKTGAYLASRAARDVVHILLEEKPELFLGEARNLKKELDERLEERFSRLAEQFPKSGSGGIKGTLKKEFATTFTMTVTIESNEGTRVIILDKGDSPTIVWTPEKIYTTHTPGAGDEVMGNDCLFADWTRTGVDLKVREINLTKGVPTLVIAGSDGIIKVPRELEGFLHLARTELKGARTLSQICDRIESGFVRATKTERDDTTFAANITTNMTATDLSRLSETREIERVL